MSVNEPHYEQNVSLFEGPKKTAVEWHEGEKVQIEIRKKTSDGRIKFHRKFPGPGSAGYRGILLCNGDSTHPRGRREQTEFFIC